MRNFLVSSWIYLNFYFKSETRIKMKVEMKMILFTLQFIHFLIVEKVKNFENIYQKIEMTIELIILQENE